MSYKKNATANPIVTIVEILDSITKRLLVFLLAEVSWQSRKARISDKKFTSASVVAVSL